MRGLMARMGRVLLALALALGLTIALGLPAIEAQSRSRTLVIAIPREPPHLDPYDSVGIQADLIYHITRKLYTFTPDMAIRPDLRAAGVRAELEIMEDVGAYLATVRRREHHMGMLGFGAATGDPDHYLRRQLWGDIAGKPWNFAGYKNAKVNQLIRVGARTMDIKERAKVYAEMQRILWNDYPWLALHRVASFAFARAGIQGIEIYLASQAHVYSNARPKEN